MLCSLNFVLYSWHCLLDIINCKLLVFSLSKLGKCLRHWKIHNKIIMYCHFSNYVAFICIECIYLYLCHYIYIVYWFVFQSTLMIIINSIKFIYLKIFSQKIESFIKVFVDVIQEVSNFSSITPNLFNFGSWHYTLITKSSTN